MRRYFKPALAGALIVLACTSVEAQQKGQPTPTRKAGQGPIYQGGIGQTPWFSNPQVRQQFNLTDQQFNQLNKATVRPTVNISRA